MFLRDGIARKLYSKGHVLAECSLYKNAQTTGNLSKQLLLVVVLLHSHRSQVKVSTASKIDRAYPSPHPLVCGIPMCIILFFGGLGRGGGGGGGGKKRCIRIHDLYIA